MTNQYTALQAHRAELRSHFYDWLLQQEPGEVLDLGAGSGDLVAELIDGGVKASGVESRGPALEAALALGRPVTELELESAGGVQLPQGVPWITIRHVLHHLRQPKLLLERAASAVTRGIMAAEPISATGLPMHRWTVELEGLLRRLDRESGMVHGPDLTVGEIAAALPPTWRKEVRMFAPMTPVPAEELESMIERSARGTALCPGDRKLAGEILAAAGDGMVALSGSAILMAHKPLSSGA